MKTKKLIVLTLLAVLLVSTMACGDGGGGEQNPPGPNGGTEGALPTLHVGDRLVLAVTFEGDHYTMAAEVTGQEMLGSKDCYVMDFSFAPPFMGIIDSATRWVDKATFDNVKMEMEGEYMELTYRVSVDASYEGPILFPLKVGKEVARTETIITTIEALGETETETEKETYTKIVESIEDVTVPAGTFRCFKVVEYDEYGNVSYEAWYSDEVKANVKEIDYQEGREVIELQSYSVR